MSNFTPGPWLLEDRGVRGVDVCAEQVGWSMVPVRIANVVPFKNALHTANLIAAAPEMYEALKLGSSKHVCCCGPRDAEKCLKCTFEAALAKADGRTA